MKKHYLKAFFWASIIYILVLLAFFNITIKQKNHKKPIPIKLSLFQYPKKPTKQPYKHPIKKITKKIIKKTIKKKAYQKKPSKKKPIKKKTKSLKKVIKSKTLKKVVKKSLDINKTKVVVLKKVKPKKAKKHLIPSLAQIGKQTNSLPQLKIDKKLLKLYGDSIFLMTKQQIKYLNNNLNTIGLITQKYLEYPYLAAKLGIKGESILEFFLFPNGDISTIKLLKSSGYEILDENSIDTVKEAYKEYPRPKNKTKIRLLVRYIFN